VEALGSADIVAGIPSVNTAESNREIVRASAEGLARSFPSMNCLIVNSDGGSADVSADTTAATENGAAAALETPNVRMVSTQYAGIRGKGSAVRAILEIAYELGARACAVVGAEPHGIGPLLRPVVENEVDFVAPVYLRHKFDGAFSNGVVYPMLRALYGKRIRQPVAGEYAFSRRLIERVLSRDVWNTDVARSGVDGWLASEGVSGGFKLAQVYLGNRAHDAKDPAPDLSDTLAQVLGPLFFELERNAAIWQKVRGSEPIPVLDERVSVDGSVAQVDVSRMVEAFRLGHSNLGPIWNVVLPPAALLDLKRMSRAAPEQFRFQDDVWARIVYDFAAAYHFRTVSRDHLLRALTPLYLAWVASFISEMADADAAAFEARIERLCLAYESQKRYLISRWRWPDRFSP
jgi:hypothetical protein